MEVVLKVLGVIALIVVLAILFFISNNVALELVNANVVWTNKNNLGSGPWNKYLEWYFV